MRTTAALLLLLLCARSAGGSGPAGHDAHRAGLERLRELENLVQQLLAAHHDDDEQGRRLQVEMDTGGGGHMGAPEEPGSAPKPTGDLGMAGMDGMDGMGHGDKMSAMPSMHASLFLFAPEGGAVGMVVVWSGWTVASWSGYAASLLVLLLWAVALACGSGAALLLVVYVHAAALAFLFGTEVPDMRRIYHKKD